MSATITNSQHYNDIASAIRAIYGEQERYYPSRMAAAIEPLWVDDEICNSVIQGTIGELVDSKITSIGISAFGECTRLTTVSFPMCTTIGDHAFGYCSALATVSFPMCTTIENQAFRECTRLKSVSFPMCTIIGIYAFLYCSALTSVSFPACTAIGNSAFGHCTRLTSLYLTGSSVCALSNSNAFTSTPIGGYSASTGQYGSIYVPATLLASYQAATNWTYFSSRFVGI